MTRKDFEEFLTELGCPDDDLKSNGGRVPDHCKYGSWLRRNDPIAFEVGYQEVNYAGKTVHKGKR